MYKNFLNLRFKYEFWNVGLTSQQSQKYCKDFFKGHCCVQSSWLMRVPNLSNWLILLESVSLHWGCFPSLHFTPSLLILIRSCSHSFNSFKGNCKTSYFAIINITILSIYYLLIGRVKQGNLVQFNTCDFLIYKIGYPQILKI